jgi:hypothetical protein
MRTLLIALGNPLRGDDGVAHAVIRLLEPRTGITTRALLQLTPEFAAELSGFDVAVFLDADVNAQEVSIEPMASIVPRPALTHSSASRESCFGLGGMHASAEFQLGTFPYVKL